MADPNRSQMKGSPWRSIPIGSCWTEEFWPMTSRGRDDAHWLPWTSYRLEQGRRESFPPYMWGTRFVGGARKA